MAKSTVSCVFGHIYKRMENLFFVQWNPVMMPIIIKKLYSMTSHEQVGESGITSVL